MFIYALIPYKKKILSYLLLISFKMYFNTFPLLIFKEYFRLFMIIKYVVNYVNITNIKRILYEKVYDLK